MDKISSLGITNLPVPPQFDPGFGLDTESKRVQFASQMEDEAYSISLKNLKESARESLIKALEIFGSTSYELETASKLSLIEIQLFWSIFVLSFVFDVLILFRSKLQVIAKTIFSLRSFLKSLFLTNSNSIKFEFEIDTNEMRNFFNIREKYGGDLIFAIKNQNDQTMMDAYKFIKNKIPESKRKEYLKRIVGIEIQYKELLEEIYKQNINNLKLIFIKKRIISSKFIKEKAKNLQFVINLTSKFSEETFNLLQTITKEIKLMQENKKYEKIKNLYGIK